jgi:hypothetical protein
MNEDRLLLQSLFDPEVRELIVPHLKEFMMQDSNHVAILNYFKTLEKLEIDDLTTFLLKVNGSKIRSDTEMETVKYIY